MAWGKGDIVIHKDRKKEADNLLKITARPRKKADEPQMVRAQYLRLPDSPELELEEDDLRDPAEFGIEVPSDEADTQETPKVVESKDLKKAAADWNKAHPVGSMVYLSVGVGKVPVKTRDEAVVEGELVTVLVEGGGVPINIERLSSKEDGK